jgi:hypothetical protein
LKHLLPSQRPSKKDAGIAKLAASMGLPCDVVVLPQDTAADDGMPFFFTFTLYFF